MKYWLAEDVELEWVMSLVLGFQMGRDRTIDRMIDRTMVLRGWGLSLGGSLEDGLFLGDDGEGLDGEVVEAMREEVMMEGCSRVG